MKIPGLILSMLIIATPEFAFAQSGSWDGVWKGYWHNRRLATIVIRDGAVIEYQSGGDQKRLKTTQASQTSLTFGYGRANNTVSLTRIGVNSAEGLMVTRFGGRIRDARNPKGYGAGSATANFTRL
jgi:hypothetical protein